MSGHAPRRACGSGRETRADLDPPVEVFTTEWWQPITARIVGQLDLAPGERVFAVGLPGLYDALPGLFAGAVQPAGRTYGGTL